jgi:hypothetical protein
MSDIAMSSPLTSPLAEKYAECSLAAKAPCCAKAVYESAGFEATGALDPHEMASLYV